MNTIDDLSRLSLYAIFGSYIPLSESECERVEQVVGCELPDFLRALFERYGCSGFKKSVVANAVEGKFPVAFLFGGGSSSYAVLETLDSFGNEFPAGMLPFAGDE